MAEPFDVVLPGVGAKPWNLNPALAEIRTRIGLSDDKLGTVSTTLDSGRLSQAELARNYSVVLPSPGNTVDIMPTIQALYDAGTRIINLQPGAVYLADSTVFLDNSNARACLTINFNGAIVNVGSNAGRPATPYAGTAGTKFLFFVNVKRTTAATVPVNESTSATGSFTANVGAGLIVHDSDWRGLETPTGQLTRIAMGNNTSLKFYGGRTSYLAGFYATAGYTDSCAPFDLRLTNPTSLDQEASIAVQQSNGDALVITAGNSDARGMICNLRYTRGATVLAPVGGGMKFVDCRDISIIGAHIEGDEALRKSAPLRVTRSLVSVRDSEFWVPTTAKTFATVEVVDGSANANATTDLLLENVTFVNVYRGDSVADEQSMPEISISSMNAGSVIRARNTWSSTITVSTTDLWRSGVRVVSSDTAIQTALTAGAAQIATGSWDLRRVGGNWKVTPPYATNLVEVIGVASAPTIDTSGATSDTSGTITAGDYVYRFAMLDGNDVYGNSSSSANVTVSSTGAARIVVSMSRPGRLVVWRRVSGATNPDRYIVLSAASPKLFLYDTGENINKRAWIKDNIPAIPATTGSASVDTLKFNGRSI